jgi:hypothetical protein
MDTNSRSISQDERLGILAQDTAVLPKGVADAEHGAGAALSGGCIRGNFGNYNRSGYTLIAGVGDCFLLRGRSSSTVLRRWIYKGR